MEVQIISNLDLNDNWSTPSKNLNRSDGLASQWCGFVLLLAKLVIPKQFANKDQLQQFTIDPILKLSWSNELVQ